MIDGKLTAQQLEARGELVRLVADHRAKLGAGVDIPPAVELLRAVLAELHEKRLGGRIGPAAAETVAQNAPRIAPAGRDGV